MEQSAIDLGCDFEDFLQQKNKVVISKKTDGCKNYFKLPHFCQLACYGNAVVASVDKELESFMTYFVSKHLGFRCFDMPQLNLINYELNKYDKCVGMIAEYLLPDLTKSREVKPEFEIEILRGNEINKLYKDDRFLMALCYTTEAERRDMIAVAGYKDGEIMGVAAASNDCATMWQVGIDVLPNYRGNGIASTLTKIITNEILKEGIVPFYGLAWSNLPSKNTALNSGYKSAWVELAAIDIKDAMVMIGGEYHGYSI